MFRARNIGAVSDLSQPAARGELAAIHHRPRGNLVSHPQEPRFAVVTSARKPGAAFVIGQILIARIAERYAQTAVRFRHVPAHKVSGIADVVPPCAASLIIKVFLPSAVQRLRVPKGRALTAHRNHTQRIPKRCARIGLEFAFLVHRRHLHVDRNAPFAFRRAKRPQVARALLQDGTCVVQVLGRRGSAAAATRRRQ